MKRIQEGRNNGIILSPLKAAERILDALPQLKDFTSGSFIDLRQIVAPEEYQELMKAKTK